MFNLMKDSSRYSAARSCKIRSKFGSALLVKIPASEEKNPRARTLVRDSKRKRLRMPLTMSGRGGLDILVRDRKRGKCSSCSLNN